MPDLAKAIRFRRQLEVRDDQVLYIDCQRSALGVEVWAWLDDGEWRLREVTPDHVPDDHRSTLQTVAMYLDEGRAQLRPIHDLPAADVERYDDVESYPVATRGDPGV